MIRLDDICFAYDSTPVLRHLSLSVERGEMLVIKGDNGCGKSTLLNIINGLDFPDRGAYTFCGDSVTAATMRDSAFAKRLHQRIGYVFQNTDAQLFCATVEDELAFGPRQMDLPPEQISARVGDMLTLMDIEHLRRRAPITLSMGEKKKVAIAAVLTTAPDVLVLDEPMNFLDKASRRWITDFLLRMKDAGKTIIIVSHTDDFDSIADRIMDM